MSINEKRGRELIVCMKMIYFWITNLEILGNITMLQLIIMSVRVYASEKPIKNGKRRFHFKSCGFSNHTTNRHKHSFLFSFFLSHSPSTNKQSKISLCASHIYIHHLSFFCTFHFLCEFVIDAFSVFNHFRLISGVLEFPISNAIVYIIVQTFFKKKMLKCFHFRIQRLPLPDIIYRLERSPNECSGRRRDKQDDIFFSFKSHM